MLYLGAQAPIPALKDEDISVEQVEEQRIAVLRWFSVPEVRFIGAPGCSCTFPHVVAEEPIQWYEGFFDEEEDRETELASVRALFALVRSLFSHSSEVQLYPVWDGEEAIAPKGTIELDFSSLDPEKFFFNEQFFYRVTSPVAAV